ncbi:MAG: DNRLRE domain-containing protein [Planctomycetota bacterium]|jgi:hypothetical protein
MKFPLKTKLPIMTIGLLVVSSPALAGSITIEPAKDNTLYQPLADEINSNGQGDYFFAGLPAHGSSRRAVIMFDIAGSVPAGSTIDSATLQLYMSRTIAGPVDVALHRLLADWGEGPSDAPLEEGVGTEALPGDCTWFDRFFPDTPWTTNGGDFEAASVGSQTVGDVGSYTWATTSGMVADVQEWLDAPANNFGWIVIGDESVQPGAKRFNSRHFSNASQRPRLTITFTEGDCTDMDQDGYGDPGSPACPNGPEEDCDDDNENINPGAQEVCDGVDNNCNGEIDELLCGIPAVSTWGLAVMLLLLATGATLVFTRASATT